MRRREFIAVVGGAAVAWPFATRAQQPAPMKRIGLLIPFADSDRLAQNQVAAFREELQRLGWNDNRNVQIVARWTGGDTGQIPFVAKELVTLKPDVILAYTTAVTAALKKETDTIPIVFVVVSDPVGDGFVANMARPGGNITGFSNVEASLGGKWLELINDIAPRSSRIAVVFGAATAADGGSYYLRMIAKAGTSAGVEIIATPVHDADEIERAIEIFARDPNGALVVTPDLTTTLHRATILAAAARYRLPAVYSIRSVTAEGGLVSYSIDSPDMFRRAAGYVDRILRGTAPSDLPVQAPIKFELAVNLKTAKALGLTVPATLLARADEVIE
jgi:putative ABC transport system substrate-binding protein